MTTTQAIFPPGKFETLLIMHEIPTEEKEDFLKFCQYTQTLSSEQNECFKDKARHIFNKNKILNYSYYQLVRVMFNLFQQGYRP